MSMVRSKKNQIIRWAIAITGFLLFLAIRSAAQDMSLYPTSNHPAIPQPQSFCGYCHILTYPTVINKGYETWKKDKHNKVGCVECHYTTPPDANTQPIITGSQPPVPASPPGHFSFIALGGKALKTTTQVNNAGCVTAACHGKPEDAFRTKKITYKDKIPFVHAPHFDKSKQIEGMSINCATCHQHGSDQTHFQVSETTCHLCHFANTQFNQGRSRCEQCHQLPAKPIQSADTSDSKPITHHMLKDAGVSCEGCHYDVFQGGGNRTVRPIVKGGTIKTVMVLGSGLLEKEACLNCHDQLDYLKKARDKKEMHRTHVNPKTARCYDCHNPILHGAQKEHRPMPDTCTSCHSRPHQYQRLLVAGSERSGIPAQPDPMFKVRTNCLGCHVEEAVNPQGQIFRKASARTCVQCHTKDYEKMLGLWQKEVGQELKKAQELEKEALAAMTRNQTKIARSKLKEIKAIIREGQEYFNIVRFGNGVHNAKYAIALLDSAIINFKDATALLEGKELSEPAFMEE